MRVKDDSVIRVHEQIICLWRAMSKHADSRVPIEIAGWVLGVNLDPAEILTSEFHNNMINIE
ncbi:MAG: hypothetical protein QOI88_4706 [Gammaproteobacteria bacterium]|jgi:hypothetical protein|nr:hypothetical protein [Gammaproteobacteria bacterium]